MGEYKYGFVVVSFRDRELYNLTSLLGEWDYVVFTDDRTVACETEEEREKFESGCRKLMLTMIRQDECWKRPTREGDKNNDHLYMDFDSDKIPYKVWPLERHNNTQDVIVGKDPSAVTQEGVPTEEMQSMFRNGELDRYYISVQKVHAHHTKEKEEPRHGSSDGNRGMFAELFSKYLMRAFDDDDD